MQDINWHIPIESIITRQIERWNRSRSSYGKEKGFPGNITLSRDFGGRGNELAGRLSEITGWKVYDREIVDYIAQNAHVRRAIVESFDEKNRQELDIMLSSLLNATSFSKETYLKYLIKTVLSIGVPGRAIFLGRGAHLILPDEQALKVRVVEDYKDRLKNHRAAEIEKEDRARAAFIQRMFGADIDRAGHYHLVLNLSRLEIDPAARMLAYMIRLKFGDPHLEKKERQPES